MFQSSPLLSCLLLATIACTSQAFVVQNSNKPALASFRNSNSRLFLKDDVADMIDKELYRQKHLKEFENEWMAKNKATILDQLNNGESMMNMDEQELRNNFRQMQKDKRLAQKSPQNYCADRCITTGNCQVYEDIFELSPEEVIKFCSNCVLSDEDEPCDIPDAFYEVIDEIGYETAADAK